ncbi:MAG: hypothetical protein HZB26_15715 [Candidatus Hydrogenedentes bacterium]|nr:hypothetical protein [Candidatus Hydrogenedentota bacterium]
MTLMLGVLSIAFAGTAHAEFRAAAAGRDVTPEKMLPVSGGAGPSSPATKKQGQLITRALVLDNGKTRVAIVDEPFLGFPASLCDRVRELVKGIPPANVIIGSAHIHSAPDCYGFPFPMKDGSPGFDPEYITTVVTKTAEAINEAVSKLQPAGLRIASGKAAEKIAYNYYAPELYDRRCHVIQAVAKDGKPIATLVNYASHPEVIGPDQGILSPDFVGPLYDRIAEKGGGTGIFMNGAQGGMVTADCRGPDGKDIQTWEECVRIGNLLADEALRIVSAAPLQENPELFCAATTITFPVESPMMQELLKSAPMLQGKNQDTTKVQTQVNVVNIGTAQVLTIPGEALPNIGFYLKRKMHGANDNNFLFGLTNDAFGYMLTRVDWHSFDRYKYVTETSLGENTGEILITEGLKFVDSCPRPQAGK